MSALKIYFGVSVSGGQVSREFVRACIDMMGQYGEVLTKNLGLPNPDGATETASQIFSRDHNLIKQCDLMIIDVTAASTGTGFMAGLALSLGKPLLALCAHDKVSAVLSGCPLVDVCGYTNIDQFQAHVGAFIMRSRLTFEKANLLFTGPAGSGKSTAAKTVAANLGKIHISTGAVLRELVANAAEDDPLATQVKKCMNDGVSVPANLMEQIVISRLTQPDCVANGFVLDGYPPNDNDLLNLLQWRIPIGFVYQFVCPDEVAISRVISRGERASDNDETARARLANYYKETPDFTRLGEIWPTTPVIMIDAIKTPDEIVAYVEEVVRNWTTLHTSSYVAIPGRADQKPDSTRWHFHIDAPNHEALLRVLRRVYATYRDASGNIKVYPIEQLLLGPQTEGSDSVYKNMQNFHPITTSPDEKTTEAFVTGWMGNEFKPEFFRAVLFAIKAEMRANGYRYGKKEGDYKFMAEVEQYLWEGTVGKGGAETTQTFEETPFEPAALTGFKDQKVEPNPPIEIHLGCNVPKNGEGEPAIPLKDLMAKCTEAGLMNGGIFIFGNDKKWRYRWNEFCYKETPEQARDKVIEQAKALYKILCEYGYPDVEVGWSLELVHAIMQF